jgi:hypothetical protein
MHRSGDRADRNRAAALTPALAELRNGYTSITSTGYVKTHKTDATDAEAICER